MSVAHTFEADRSTASAGKLFLGFVAGFISVLLFHQTVLAVLDQVGFAQADTFSLHATAPFHVPEVISLAFWGGVWGVVFAAVERRFPRGGLYWLYAFGFGAIFPTLAAWFIVAPLKGSPVAAGWQFAPMTTGIVINGAWGLGTGLLLALGCRIRRSERIGGVRV